MKLNNWYAKISLGNCRVEQRTLEVGVQSEGQFLLVFWRVKYEVQAYEFRNEPNLDFAEHLMTSIPIDKKKVYILQQ